MSANHNKKTFGKLLMKIFLGMAITCLVLAIAAGIAVKLAYHVEEWKGKKTGIAQYAKDKRQGDERRVEPRMDFKITINQEQKIQQTEERERLLPRTFGVITKIDGPKITILNNADVEENVFSQSYTIITYNNRQISLAELKVGQKALFVGTVNRFNQLGVESINVSN